MKKLSKILLAAAGALALFTVSANAATFNANTDEPLVLGTPNADDILGNVEEGVSGTVIGQRTSPWDGTLNPSETYTAVRQFGSAGYNLGGSFSSVSFRWGSIDDHNTVNFFSDNILVDSLTGVDVLNGIGELTGLATRNVNITTDVLFDRIVFTSAGDSFEYANLQVSVVPLPAALPLYGAGVALLGFMGWRKRKNAA